MSDPFADAFAVLLNAPGSVGGVYTQSGEGPLPIRALRSAPSETVDFKFGSAVVDANVMNIAITDVAHPMVGDSFVLDDGTSLSVLAEPKRDAEGVSWRVEFG